MVVLPHLLHLVFLSIFLTVPGKKFSGAPRSKKAILSKLGLGVTSGGGKTKMCGVCKFVESVDMCSHWFMGVKVQKVCVRMQKVGVPLCGYVYVFFCVFECL